MRTTLFSVALCVALVTSLLYFNLRRGPSVETKRSEALRLIAKAGGAEKICLEAIQVFERFDGDQIHPLKPAELANCPLITSLGEVDGVWPDNPPYIKIRVGDHIRGFLIYIVRSTSGGKGAPSGAEHVDGCVYVL